MFLRYRATRRKFKRLSAEVKTERGRADALDVEVKRLQKELKVTNEERFEREMRLIDRVLVSKDRFAITDEVRHTVAQKDEESLKRKSDEDLKYYLQRRKQEIIDDALEAGETVAAAEKLYLFNEQSYIDEFSRSMKFE